MWTTHEIQSQYFYHMDGHTLTQVKKANYLGIKLSSDLICSEQFSSIT